MWDGLWFVMSRFGFEERGVIGSVCLARVGLRLRLALLLQIFRIVCYYVMDSLFVSFQTNYIYLLFRNVTIYLLTSFA